jgi:predicted component of type VI protein secretion system
MVVKLIVASGKSAGRSIAIKRNKLLIGRAEECDIRPLSEDVSRRHCQVTVEPTQVWVEDLGSRNGTFVNGAKIEARTRTRVSSGDVIRVGALELKVSCGAPTAQSNEDDVSRWLMADDQPAGMSDTTQSMAARTSGLSAVRDDSSAVETTADAAAGGSFVSGIDSVPGMSPAASSHPASSSTADARSGAKGTPATAPQKPAAKGADSSRDAAAEALKKFFGGR